MYTLEDKTGAPILMRDGTPFKYSTERLAEMGAKYLRPKVPKNKRPIRIVGA